VATSYVTLEHYVTEEYSGSCSPIIISPDLQRYPLQPPYQKPEPRRSFNFDPGHHMVCFWDKRDYTVHVAPILSYP
jgi:hypothetical protein